MTIFDLWRRTAAACLAGMVFAETNAALAEDASRWDGDARSAIRLIAGSRQEGGALYAGVQVRLRVGWHTYWRYPGDSGIPPQFDFGGSRNVRTVDVLWPAPQRIADAGMTSIGYLVGVVFPLRVVPQDASQPALVRLKLDYAVCEKLCVPAEGRGELTVPAAGASQDRAIAASVGRVPKLRALGEGGTLAIKSVRVDAGPGRPRMVVDVAAPAGADVDLFAEGPTPKWALPVPSPVAAAPAGLRRFAFELDGAPPGEVYDRLRVTLTAVTATEAIEITTRLD
jgi:DsbC/DsbD-like thiol-disulfide interchange protein